MSTAVATVLAGLAAALAGTSALLAMRALAAAVAARARGDMHRSAALLERVLRPLRLAGEQGLVPTDTERLRLQALAGGAGLVAGLTLAGPVAGLALGLVSAWLAARSLGWRRERYRRRVEAGGGTAALALADAISGGHSVRGALGVAAAELSGPMARELSVAAREIEVGGGTDQALERLRRRCGSRRADLVVAAVRVQRRSGGALAALLRDIAGTIDEQDRLYGEARAATAQARFTSWIVAVLPAFVGVLGELASPGFVTRLASSAIALPLVVVALLLQAAGLLLVRRLAKVAV